MQKRTWLRLAMAGSLTCALAAGAETETTQAAPETTQEGAAIPAEATEAAPSQEATATLDGLVVVRDPETGALRAPTAAEAAALRLGMDPLAESDAGLTPTYRADGGMSLVLGDRFLVTSVVHRNAAGALDRHSCADDPQGVERALANEPAPAAEVNRDDQ